jgi:hypothetical protein
VARNRRPRRRVAPADDRRSVAIRRPSFPRQPFQRDRATLGSPRRWQREQYRLFQQQLRSKTGYLRPRHQVVGERDGQIAAAIAHDLDRIGGFEFAEHHVHVREAIAQPHDGRKQMCLGERREAADFQCALRVLVGRAQIAFGGLDRLQDRVRMRHQPRAFRGEAHAAPDMLQLCPT